MLLALIISQACEGPEGEVGPQGDPGPTGATGPAGPAGTSGQATVFEVGDTLTADNNYSIGIGFAANDIEVSESDVVLVYLLAFTDEDAAGNIIPFWSPLPQTYYFNNNPVMYNYYFATLGVVMYLDAAEAVLPTLSEAYTNAVFRVVIIPGTALNGRTTKPNIDYKNYSEVAKYYNITEASIKKVNLK